MFALFAYVPQKDVMLIMYGLRNRGSNTGSKMSAHVLLIHKESGKKR